MVLFKGISNSIRVKLTLAFIALVTLPLVALGLLSLRLTTQILQANAQARFAILPVNEAGAMENFLDRAEGDETLLAQSGALQNLLAAADPATRQSMRNRVAAAFSTFIQHKPFYETVAFLDESGQPVVRVTAGGDVEEAGQADRAPGQADQPYFVEAMELAPGEIFISPPTLNSQTGPSPEAVIHQATPVFDDQGRRRGALVITFRASELLPSPSATHNLPGEHEFLVDEQGYYLVHTDPARAWSGPANRATGHRLQRDYPSAVVEAILSGEQGVVSEGLDSFMAYAPVFPDPDDAAHFWVTVDQHPKSAVLAPAWQFRLFFLAILVAALGGGVMLSLVVSRRMSEPLLALREGAQRIGQGDLEHRITLTTGDEIEALATEFNRMTGRLQTLYEGLEQKVIDRTAALTALNAVSFAVNNSLDLESDLAEALEVVRRELGFEAAWVFLPVEEGRMLRLAAAPGLPPEFRQQEALTPLGRCQCEHVLAEGRPKRRLGIDHCRRLLPYQAQYPDFPLEHISLPIFSRQKTVGVLNLSGPRLAELGPDQIKWLETVAQQVGHAVENARLYENALDEAVRLTALNRVSTIASRSLQLAEMLPALLQEMTQALGMSHGLIALRQKRGPDYRVRASYGDPETSPDLEAINWAEFPLWETMARTQTAEFIPDSVRDERLRPWRDLLEREGIGSVLALPVMIQESIRGFMLLYTVGYAGSCGRADLQLAQTLTNQAALAIEKAALHEAAIAAYEEELQMARQIQQNLLPRTNPTLPGLQTAGLCQPARATGGDFYDYIPLTRQRLAIVVGDVTGKSLPAAIVMALTRNTVRLETVGHIFPAQALSAANHWLSRDIRRGTFVAMVAALFDPTQHTMWLVNAGQTATLLVRQGQTTYLLPDEAAGLPLGLTPDQVYGQVEIPLQPDDTLLFYTDGIVEAKNSAGEMFGFERLEAAIHALAGRPDPQQIIDGLMAEMRRFVGQAEQHDDITLVAVRVGCEAGVTPDDEI